MHPAALALVRREANSQGDGSGLPIGALAAHGAWLAEVRREAATGILR